jgi:tRNA pseudouridine55 synthase
VEPGRVAVAGMDGILVVAKPPGPTSHDVVALVRRLAATKRVGHGGTLDPFASGVLPLFLGRATRVAEYHLGDRKAYHATVCFGATSTTDDLEGEQTPAAGPAPAREAVEAALPAFRGSIVQTPPAFSAIKVAGRRAYAMARAGTTPTLAPRPVEIHRLDLVSWAGDDPDRPVAEIEVECSAGTYIRALARDLGVAVGNGAYLGALSRTASGPFRLEDSVPLAEVRTAAADGPAALRALLRPIDFGLERFPVIEIAEADVSAVARGQLVRPPGPLDDGDETRYRVTDPGGRLIAIAALRNGRLAPDKVFVDAPPPQDGRAALDVDAAEAAEADPPTSVDPDPASPDDV